MASQTDEKEIDINVGNVPDFDNLVSGGLQTMPETDGEVISKPSYFTSRSAGKTHRVQRSPQYFPVKNFVENLDRNESAKHIFDFEEEKKDIENVNKNTPLENATKFIYRSVSENTTQSDDHIVKSGVSEQYFNNLVKELRKTKGLLSELLQNQNIKLSDAVTWKQNKDQQTQIRHLITENEKVKTECENLQNKLEKVHSELCMFKSILKKEKEGETIHPTTTQPKTIGSRSNSKEAESLNSDGSEVNSSKGFITTLKSGGSGDNSVTKSDQVEDSKVLSNQLSQEELNREKQQLKRDLNQMKRCLEMAMIECDKSKQEKDEVTKSYTQLLSTCDELRKQKDDAYLPKLVQENGDLRKKLKETQEDNLDYLSHIETLQNNFTREKEALKAEKESHNRTKHELHIMYEDLKRKYDKVFHEKTQLQQQIFEQKSLPSRLRSNVQTLSTASPASLSVSSLQSAKMDYFDTARKQPKESVNISPDPPAEELCCERCHSEFDDTMTYLHHIQNCLP